MRRVSNLGIFFISLFLIAVIAYNCTDNGKSNTTLVEVNASGSAQNSAFLDHRDSVPSKQQYGDSLFQLSHDYPATVAPVVNPLWRQALNGQPISASNVFAYMDALKKYVAPRLLPFFTDNKQWNAAKYGWFHEPWMGSQREAILGTYLGNGNPANMFTSLKMDEAGYVLVLYDSTAAYSVGQVWSQNGTVLNLANNAAQFKEGSVVVKLAFSNINYPDWPVMKGAQQFDIYDTIATKESPDTGYQLRKVSFFQMDVIVKDSLTSPKTGWVYSTFVYDKDVQGSPWDQMVPLGAMWGNDPDIISPLNPPYPKLNETVINPKAPAYSKETLGWGGRLSGPNDGAVAQVAFDRTTGKQYKNLALSSCMSCHLPAQVQLKSFLLPGPFPTSDTLFVFTPGSAQWNLWFKDNYGNVPFDSGQVATDYDMVTAFKSVLAYQAANPSIADKQLMANIEAVKKFRRHSTRSRFWH